MVDGAWARAGLVSGLVLLAGSGCGPATGACNVDTCSHGCCDSTGTCQSAGTDAVCGLHGNACFPCEGTAHCSAGSCLRVVDCDGGAPGDAGLPSVDAGPSDAGQPARDAGTDAGTVDAGVDAGEVADAAVAPPDAGVDAGPGDAGDFDAGEFDAGDFDAGEFDAGGFDAGPVDAGEADAGPVDAGVDAGAPDAGVDAGTDAGVSDAGARVCRVLSTFPLIDGFSVYGRSADGGLEHAVSDVRSASTMPYNTLEFDVYWAFQGHPTTLVIPAVRDLAVEPNYSICTTCVVIRENCVALDSCERAFLARAGTATLTEITRGYSGQFRATLENVRFESWALGADVPLDAGCIILDSASFDFPR